jgi:plastocyanin
MHRSIIPSFISSLALAAVHTVLVGPTAPTFVPRTISAVQGDTVVFELFSGHNVVEGDFHSPCETDEDNFYSGPYSDTNGGNRKFVVNITSNDPVYYYCSVHRHCQSGMVGGINIPYEKTTNFARKILTRASTSGDETIDVYSQAAACAQQAKTPEQLRGGHLLDNAQIASLASSGVASSISDS